jgi:YVTN family beta-propeller protein
MLACGVGISTSASSKLSAGVAAFPRGGKVIAVTRIPPGVPGFGGIGVGEGAVWVVSGGVPTLSRIDPERNAVIEKFKVKQAGGLAVGEGAVWVSHPLDDVVSRVDPRTNSVVATIHVGAQPEGVAVSPGAIWIANVRGSSVSRIDPATNQVVATIKVGPAGACCPDHMSLTAGTGSVWVTLPSLHALVRIDPAKNAVVATVRVGTEPCGFVVAGPRMVWVSGAHCTSAVAAVDPRTNRAAGKVTSLVAPIGLGVASGSLWVADLDSKAIDRVNERTRRVIGRLRVGGFPVRLATGFGSVWVEDDTGRVLRVRPQR